MAKKGRRILKPGLWHGPRRVEVQVVNTRMKKACAGCSEQPQERRLRVVDGVARSAKETIYCVSCGTHWIQERRSEAARAIRYLKGECESIRT